MVSERLARARREREVSAFTVARETGLSPNTIYRAERNKKPRPSLDTIAKLARFYRIPFEVRFDGRPLDTREAA